MENLVNMKQPEELVEEAMIEIASDVSDEDAAEAEPAHSAMEVESSVATEDPQVEPPSQPDASIEPHVAQAIETVEVVEDIEAAEVVEDIEAAEVVEDIEAAEVVEDIELSQYDDFAAELDMEEAGPPSMAEFVDDISFTPLKTGEVRDGVIVSMSSSEILIDVGAKSEGFIHNREMERHGREYAETLNVGDSVVVYVVRPEDRDGNVVLSLSRAQQERDWREAERMLESGEVFESTIIGFNRGGVICRLGKVRGFIPASQLVSKPEKPAEGGEDNRWAGLVGQEVWLKVIELDRRRNRLILSERLAVRDRRRQKKDQLLSELKKGDVRKGRVSSIAKFGAFVDLGGADGLVHLSELSWARVNHPNEVIKVGQEVEVYVLNVDRERKRIGLSLRRLEPEPWSVVHERYAVGQLVDGVITKLASFGAFARVEGTIEGLIHISELANHRVTHPKEVVKEGQELTLRIIRIDPSRRRMGLSLKRVAEEEYAELDWREDFQEEEFDDEEFEQDWTSDLKDVEVEE